jgi:hypothetical protein
MKREKELIRAVALLDRDWAEVRRKLRRMLPKQRNKSRDDEILRLDSEGLSPKAILKNFKSHHPDRCKLQNGKPLTPRYIRPCRN